jgi:hypothetical protein
MLHVCKQVPVMPPVILCYRSSAGAVCSQLVHTCCCAVVCILQEGEPQGRHVVIVDDLVQSGGTLIECHALLSSLGAKHGEEIISSSSKLACTLALIHHTVTACGGYRTHCICLPGGLSGLPAAALLDSASSPCWQTVTPLAQHSSGTPQPCHRFGGEGPAVCAALVHGAASDAGCGAWGTCPALPTLTSHGTCTHCLAAPAWVHPHLCIFKDGVKLQRSQQQRQICADCACLPLLYLVLFVCAVSAYVTHGVFPRESWKKFKADNGGEAGLGG